MTRQDFETSLQDPIADWGSKTKKEIRMLLGDRAAEMAGYEQRNPHHCYTLFDHVLHVVKGIPSGAGTYTKAAAFFHDIGKPDVAMEKNGMLVFYGHAKKSAEIADQVLKSIGYQENEIRLICFYIAHHDDFISWVLPTETYDHSNPYLVEITPKHLLAHIGEKTVYPEGIFELTSEEALWENLLALCQADIMAQTEHVMINGVEVSSVTKKMAKITLLKQILPIVMKMKQGKIIV